MIFNADSSSAETPEHPERASARGRMAKATDFTPIIYLIFGEIKIGKTGGVSISPKKNYLKGMNTTKNYAIAILTGLLALSLSIQPSSGAAKKDSPSRLIEYATCLELMVESTAYAQNVDNAIQFDNWFSQMVLNCSTVKPVELVNWKSANYKQCLSLGSSSLKYSFIKPNKNEQWETADLRTLLTLLQGKCKAYRP